MRIYAQAIISSFAVSPNLDPDVNCRSELRSHLQVFAALTHQTPETMNPTHHKSGLQQKSADLGSLRSFSGLFISRRSDEVGLLRMKQIGCFICDMFVMCVIMFVWHMLKPWPYLYTTLAAGWKTLHPLRLFPPGVDLSFFDTTQPPFLATAAAARTHANVWMLLTFCMLLLWQISLDSKAFRAHLVLWMAATMWFQTDDPILLLDDKQHILRSIIMLPQLCFGAIGLRTTQRQLLVGVRWWQGPSCMPFWHPLPRDNACAQLPAKLEVCL